MFSHVFIVVNNPKKQKKSQQPSLPETNATNKDLGSILKSFKHSYKRERGGSDPPRKGTAGVETSAFTYAFVPTLMSIDRGFTFAMFHY